MKKSIGPQTLVYPTPAWVVCTYDANGKPNGMTAAWGGICCSDPPCIAVSLRKATYSYGNLIAQKAFTINVPSEDQVKALDYFGLVSGRNTDKFAVAHLTPVRSDLVNAPYIAEFPLVLECTVVHVIELGLHTQFVGRIEDVKADENTFGPDGRPAVDRVKPVIFSPGSRLYHGLGPLLGQAFSIGKSLPHVVG
jgi:flavin reductase (DIM6/NTAB) family NADH-FMN oxidoreductase RutF